ncbi:MerR family transcriptional regulator [Companilactobacillus futsaii]|uniref:MerR family transcriptional regulator n=2 Tax=Companilactobacillus futsaii TaxID=938155 RepID=A0A5B7T365_9LACO|nr:MerR family transcriptional regulator [Companilactobacillus futsaii]KRK99706.1 transcriptional regulator [Companilactobacillus futsaii JCM 17355]QCX24755.1 MerR family transcriptional regulator [Companilactobacillus futsaii]
MLKISEMADLANTTRRTLIFYDQEDIFTPNHRNNNGYRLYDYDQLYDLLFILGLRNLDIPLSDIKNIQNSTTSSRELLSNTQSKINNKISELVKIQRVLNKKIEDKNLADDEKLYEPSIKKLPKKLFWHSISSSGCTADEVAQLFSNFYKHLDNLAIMETGQSGFFTDLSIDNPNDYPDASFQVIKEITNAEIGLPIIEKPAGLYACILVRNNGTGINHGLTSLKGFCRRNNLSVKENLWQINTNNDFVETGSSKFGWLEYQINS